MINNRYSLDNYRKHLPLFVTSRSLLFPAVLESSELLIKWKISIGREERSNGLVKVKFSETPIGRVPDISLSAPIYKDFLIQFLTINTDSLPYQLEFSNPPEVTKSIIEVWEYIPPIFYSNSYMPSNDFSPPTPPITDPVLIAAINTNTQAINALPVAIGDKTNKPTTTTREKDFTIGAGIAQLFVKNDAIQGMQIVNAGSVTVRFWVQDAPLNTATLYDSPGWDFELSANKSWELPHPLYRSNIWAIAKNPVQGATLACTFSTI